MSPQVLFELLADYLGSEAQALDFMRTFSGVLSDVPRIHKIEQFARELRGAERISADASTENVRAIATFNGTPCREVTKAFQRISGRTITTEREQQLREKLRKWN